MGPTGRIALWQRNNQLLHLVLALRQGHHRMSFDGF